MALILTVPFTWPNGTRLVIDKVRANEETAELTVVIQLRTPAATNYVASEKVIVLRNGVCDRLSRAVLTDLQNFGDWLAFEPGALTVATGYTDAFAAWKAGATPAARRTALETHLLSVGYLHSSLAGT